jgi:hypothetical protein
MKNKPSTLLERLKPQGKNFLTKMPEEDLECVNKLLTKYRYISDITLIEYVYLVRQFGLTTSNFHEFCDLFYTL